MTPQSDRQIWLKLTALGLVGGLTSVLLNTCASVERIVEDPTQVATDTTNAALSCNTLPDPLTPEEVGYAQVAWQYFVDNYQPDTGFTNAAGNYPSGTLWDMGNYLMALNGARWLSLIDQEEFDYRLNQFLTSLGELPLFEDALPNKVYNTATGQMVDYANQPSEEGLGWSALDMGRILVAFHVIRTCHPQYSDWLAGIVERWHLPRSVKDGQLYGASLKPDGNALLVQEGRLGYEEYAAKGYELWGFNLPKALELQPFKMVKVNGVEIPVDTRNFAKTDANNYVVSESYILEAIEFGLPGNLGQYAANLLEVQKKRYQDTGKLTAVSEDNIDQAPHFLYNTVYANGIPWAVITEDNEAYPNLRTLSTKAAFGWHYLYPDDAYTQQIFAQVKNLQDSDGGGYFAGIYESNQAVNQILTGNTNGLIIEILFYKARGNRSLIENISEN
ncbi:MAG: DUF3131 domain-containing protein [Cyanothece sp. SIO1E1]|nr:DUF3131 domain-containing protein [Cyanothece sp. SIO1E1]